MTKKKTEQKYVFISLPFWSSRDKKGPVPIGIKVDKNRESLLDADSFERVGKNYNC
ncbi:MAG: hypothetical protein HWD59_09430 [Coxiellaceae bacterium]|nr:MAG: hypothetical protein HWD59_09430 [Coxiellaceae bacterium]